MSVIYPHNRVPAESHQLCFRSSTENNSRVGNLLDDGESVYPIVSHGKDSLSIASVYVDCRVIILLYITIITITFNTAVCLFIKNYIINSCLQFNLHIITVMQLHTT